MCKSEGPPPALAEAAEVVELGSDVGDVGEDLGERIARGEADTGEEAYDPFSYEHMDYTPDSNIE